MATAEHHLRLMGMEMVNMTDNVLLNRLVIADNVLLFPCQRPNPMPDYHVDIVEFPVRYLASEIILVLMIV